VLLRESREATDYTRERTFRLTMLIAGRTKGAAMKVDWAELLLATFVVGYVLVILLDVFAGVGP
jgi:hypothetical protein